MTLYAGETVLIKHSATLDGETLVYTDISTCQISIYDLDLVEVLAATAMSWNSTSERWEYAWDSPGPDRGTYKVKVRIVGLDGSDNWEYKTIRLKQKAV